MILQALLKRLQAFRSDRDGNVAIIFAIMLVPVFGLVGLAIDYNRAVGVRTSMQAAVDATALMLSKEANGLTTDQLQSKANDYFTANFKRPDGKNLVVTPTFTSPAPGNWSLNLKATAKVDTLVTRWISGSIWGTNTPQQMNLAASSQVNWGMKKLELALALDNTGSMASLSKMTELKKAVKSLLDTLKAAEKASGDIKLSIIPFDTMVRIGTSYKDKAWFDTSICADYEIPASLCSSIWKQYWDGCVQDRSYPYDTQDDAPGANPATLYPIALCGGAPGVVSSLAQALPLTSNWTALSSKVDEMQPNGNTNVTIGLMWAWHSLTAQEPYNEALAPKSDLDKVIILLTDGDNTESWKNATREKVITQTAINARTKLACDNVRKSGIKLYTVRVINGNADLLRDCATTPNMYYDVAQASELNAVFNAIANSLANLYIAR
jgi:Flp pilus assembly protein TadG